MHPEDKSKVIDFIMAQPYDGIFKKQLLLGWAVTVGVRLQARDYSAVAKSGTDQ